MLCPVRTGGRLFYCPCLILFILLLSVGAGCRADLQPQRPAEGRTFTDETARQVAIRANPQRIISLAPNITETLFALGLADRIVGVTSYCDHPAAARTKESVGDTINPNLERIIALRPDLVIVTTASQLERLTRQLDELQIPVYVTNPRTVQEVIASIRRLGEITGTTERAGAVAGDMERRLAAVRTRVQDRPRVRVLYILQISPLITAGRDTFINDLIGLAGGTSISGAEQTDYPQYSRETVVARNPEIIIVPVSHGTELVDLAEVRRDFAVTAAVREQRIESIDPDLISRPGPRIIAGLEEMAAALHGGG